MENKNTLCLHVEHYSTVKKKEIKKGKLMKLEIIVLNEVTQIQKDKHLSHVDSTFESLMCVFQLQLIEVRKLEKGSGGLSSWGRE